MRETWVQSLGWEDPLEKGKATHSSILARIILWTISTVRVTLVASFKVISAKPKNFPLLFIQPFKNFSNYTYTFCVQNKFYFLLTKNLSLSSHKYFYNQSDLEY